MGWQNGDPTPRQTLKQMTSGREVEPGTARKMGTNFCKFVENGKLVYRLVNQDIVVVDGMMATLDSGGWRTMYTRRKMNEALADAFPQLPKYYAPLFADRGMMFASRGWQTSDAERVAFYDGMRVKVCEVVGHRGLPEYVLRPVGWKAAAGREGRRTARLEKKLDAFCAKLKKVLSKGPLWPEAGDCFVCRGFFGSERPSCLMGHLDEKYVHGSLVLAAMREAGHTDEGFQYWMSRCPEPRHVSLIVRRVRRYIRKHVGMSI